MTDSITPPPELVQQWYDDARDASVSTFQIEMLVATRAAQWGADTELEACLANIHTMYGKHKADWLREMRRPEPPSLKQQALTALYAVATGANDTREQHQDLDTIRRALEALPE